MKKHKKNRGQSAARLKEIRRKYHLGEFRTPKTSKHRLKPLSRKVYKHPTHSFSMAKRHKKSYARRAFSFTTGLGIDSALYGYAYKNFVQSPMDNIVRSLTANVAINIGDNIARGVALIALKKFMKNPIVTKIAEAGLAVEGANFSLNSSVAASTNGGNSYVLS